MPHLSPLAWTFLFVLIWYLMFNSVLSSEYNFNSLNK